jgi:hypothetical protein
VGVIYTDREFAGYFNRVGGIDTTIRFGKNWNATARSVVSSTHERLENDQFLPYNSPTPPGNQYFFGSATEAMLIGQGRLRMGYAISGHHPRIPDRYRIPPSQ